MVNKQNGQFSDEWKQWFDNRVEQMKSWLVEDAAKHSHLPSSVECDPPKGIELLAADWNVFRKSEVEVLWDYQKYGPMILGSNLAYDGKKLYNPLSGRTWSNIVEVLETEVKEKFGKMYPDANVDVFEMNDGFFWSTLLQQWYDNVNVSYDIY